MKISIKNAIKRSAQAKLLLFVALLFSCDDIVDLQPISELSTESFWQNNNDAASGVIAIYDGMQAAFNQEHFFYGEFRADNYVEAGERANAQRIELVQNNITTGNNQVLTWRNLYVVISRANAAIKYIPQIPSFDENLLAEAYAIRAYTYFEAVKVWGAVPLFTEPIENTTDVLFRPKTDGQTIFNEVIIPDMLEAERLMTIAANKYRFAKTTIWALQADVYMWLQDYANAKIALDKIVASGEYSLVTTVEDWQNMFLNDVALGGKFMEGPELMLSINYDLNESGNDNRAGIHDIFYAGLPTFALSPTLENKWRSKFPIDSTEWVTKYPDTAPALMMDSNGDGVDDKPVYGDWRYYWCRQAGVEGIESENPVIGRAQLAKYAKTNYNIAFDDSDIVLYRYADMLYLLAEAENQLSNPSRALELVNQIRTARLLPLVSESEFGATTDERENYILDERQLELLGESHRWWDLRRTGKAIEVLNPILETINGGVQLTEDRLLFPFFNIHLLENPELVQNAGY